VYWRTNPHPATGAYFFPEQVESHVVKVFIPGLVRTDRAYIGQVVATVRHWREYESSMARLHAMENTAREQAGRSGKPPVHMPAVLEWWHENYALLRDIVTRRYRVHVQSYDGLLADPEKVVRDTLSWLGKGDAAQAIAAVKPERRTQIRADTGARFDPELESAFDLLYDTVHQRRPVTRDFITQLNTANVALAPRIREAQRAVMLDARRRQSSSTSGSTPGPPGETDEPEQDDEQPTW
jgi:hypothetical protein